jgi:penicillin amidase
MALAHETIRVKGEPDEHLLVRRTRHGPLVSDVLPGASTALALRWTALDADDRLVESYRALSLASTWETFTVAVAGLRSPMLNFVYADVDGNIGYFAPGALPIRGEAHDSRLPVPGWTGDHEWLGYVPLEQLPRIYNPTRGFVVTANNQVMPDDYPYPLGTNWEPAYRAARITALLEDAATASVDVFARMQMDVRSPEVRILLPWLLRARLVDDESRAVVDRLKRWDGALTPSSGEAAIYAAWVEALSRHLFEDELGPVLWEEWGGLAPWRVKAIDFVITRSEDRWCDDIRTTEAESCEQILGAALRDALDGLRARQGSDPARWQLGRDSEVTFAHQPLDGAWYLRRLFSRRVAVGGNATTVAPVMRLGDRQVIASFRQIIDLADFDRSQFMLPLGQSGQVGSRHYADLLDPWRQGDYAPMPFTRGAVDAATVDRLVLTPR